MYQIINDLPIDYDFSSKTKEDLKLYQEWFNENKEKRIKNLSSYIKETHGYENWEASFSPDSLKKLGKWLVSKITKLELTEEEYVEKKLEIPEWIEIPKFDLSVESRSILIDAGIYFGEVLIYSHHNLKWTQYSTKIKDHVNNGHMCISLKVKEINPVWLLYILGIGLVKKTKNEDSLYDLYKIWESYI